MSLETLLQAAKYLDHVEKNTGVMNGFYSENASSASGHLLIDPNLPISCQFHTYSSSAPVKGSMLPVTRRNPNHKLSSHTEKHTAINGRLSGNTNKGSREGLEKTAKLNAFNHRELHKTLEKNRRAHLRDCFEQLKKELPQSDYRKSSHINIIHCALRYIQYLKRAENEIEREIERLTRARLRHQNTIIQLKEDLDYNGNRINIDGLMKEVASQIVESDMNNGSKITLEEENSEGDVVVELDPNQVFDDETTTTASECAEDARESVSSSYSFDSMKNGSFVSQCV